MPESSPKRKRRDSSGLTVDATGAPAIDPTENVLSLVEAAVKRLDDLRNITSQLVNAKLEHLTEIGQLRAEHAGEVRRLESDRLDKIRQVDVLAGNTSMDRAMAAIQTLAATTTSNAETLRSMLSNTASTIASQTNTSNAALTERIAALEKSSYTGAGKQALADPMLTELITEMRAIRQIQAGGTGKSEGKSAMWGYVAAGFGFVLTLGSLIVLIIKFLPVKSP